MKKIYALLTAIMLTIAATGQTLNVKMGSVTYQFPSSQTGDMTYADGQTVTIMGKTFSLDAIDAMTVDDSSVADGTIAVNYSGTAASVTVAGNVAQYVTPTVSGAHVSIVQSDDLDQEITYSLSGSSTDGEFYLSGTYKATIELNGLTLTNGMKAFDYVISLPEEHQEVATQAILNVSAKGWPLNDMEITSMAREIQRNRLKGNG